MTAVLIKLSGFVFEVLYAKNQRTLGDLATDFSVCPLSLAL